MTWSIEKKQGVFILPGIISLLAGIPVSAMATKGDVYAKETEYCATTYGGHYVYSKVGGVPVDLNVGSGDDDDGKPLYAPKDGGYVTIATRDGHNDDGWGNSITWTDGNETLYLAHLSDFGETGSVDAGETIGYVGKSGGQDSAHLHIQSSKGQLYLSGIAIIPDEYPKCRKGYTSKGPARSFFHVEESDGFKSVKIEWYPANKSCVDAYIRFYNNTCDTRPAEEICKEAQSRLAGFSWKYLYGDWKNIFFGHNDIKKYVERVGSCNIDKPADKPDMTCFQF